MIPKLYTPSALPDPLDLFGQMLAQAPFAVWLADREGRVFLFNEAMRVLLDIDDPAHVFERYNLFQDPIAMGQGLVPYIKRVLQGQVIQTVVVMDMSQEDFGPKNGKEPKVFYVRCLYFPLKNDRGDFEYVVSMIENITQDYLEDLEISRKALALQAANREIVEREQEIAALKRRKAALEGQLRGLKGV